MRHHSFAFRCAITLLAACGTGAAYAAVVISQVYGGGGNSGAPWQNDFIELFNAGSTPQDLSGWSVQYASASGTTWNNLTELPAITLEPGRYLLIQEGAGAGNGDPLPAPDVVDATPISMAAANGKIALVNSTSPLSGSCPTTDAGVVDFVGYGTANCAEGTAVGALSNTTAALRNDEGCSDNGDNGTDFTVAAPAPRNGATPAHSCGGGSGIVLSIAGASVDEGDSGTVTLIFDVTLSAPADGDVTFDIATVDGSASAGSDYVAHAISGAIIADGTDHYAFEVTVNGDTDPEADEVFSVVVDNISGSGVDTTSASATGTIVNDDPLRIFHIQGNGAHSPFLNMSVTTSGEVTALGAGGFFMQDAQGDGDPNTSDAIFVYTANNNPAGLAVGDIATVTGTIIEFYGMTEFGNSPPAVVDYVAGTPTVEPLLLDLATPSPDPQNPRCQGSFDAADSIAVRNWRCLQSMRVRLDDGAVSAPNYRSFSQPLNEFFAYVAGHARPMRGPGLVYGSPDIPPPGGPWEPPVWDGAPHVFGVDTRHFDVARPMNGGMHFSADGIMGFDFGIGMLWPFADGFTITDPGPDYPVAVAEAPAGALTIGSQNMLRLFNDVHDSGSVDACADTNPGSQDTCPTPAQFDVRLAKLSLLVREVLRAPAVLAVQEVENLPTLQALAERIGLDDATLSYTAWLVEGNDVGGIDVGFLVRGDVTVNAVTQLYADEQTDACSGSAPCLLNDRPPLLLDAALGDYRFAVLGLHSRSLNGIDDPADGPRVRQKRLEQARTVARIAQAWQSGDTAVVPGADADVPLAIVGDFNAFGFSDGYVDVVGQVAGTAIESENLLWEPSPVDPPLLLADEAVPQALRYSFVFDGYAQKLDHALLTVRAAEDFLALSISHGNADVPAGADDATDPATARRSSDHDGFVLQLATAADDDTLFRDGFDGD